MSEFSHLPTVASNALSASTVSHELPQSIMDGSSGNGAFESIMLGGALVVAGAGGWLAHKWSQRRKSSTGAVSADEKAIQEAVVTHSIPLMGARLILKDLLATVDIDTSSPQTGITIVGKQKIVNRVRESATEQDTTIAGPAGVFYVRSPSLIKEHFIFKRLQRLMPIEYVTPDDTMTITAHVPPGTNLDIADIHEAVNATGQYGDVSIDSAYQSRVQIEEVKGAKILADSSSTVDIRTVNGPLDIDAGYNSTVTVHKGTTPRLVAELDSSSRVTFNGSADSASIDAGYNSKAHVERADGKVAIESDSSSTVVVNGGSADKLIIDAGYNSHVVYNGVADRAHVELDSSSSARINEVTNFLDLDAGYNSKCVVESGDIEKVRVEMDSSSAAVFGGRILSGYIEAGYNSSVRAAGYDPSVKIETDSSSRVTS